MNTAEKFNTHDFKKLQDQIMNPGLMATIRRMAYVSALGIVSMLFLGAVLDVDDIYSKPLSIILAVVGINMLSEGNIIINRILNQRVPWFSQITKRIRIQVFISVLWLIAVTVIFSLLAPRSLSKDAIITFIFGTIFILGFNSVLIMRSFAYNWRQSLIENEELKQAKLKSDYMALQNQLNPHFLFNSFSVLISEIQYNPPGAVEFAQKMSDVYRYVLQQRNNLTTTLKEELDFLDDFRYLHNIRMGNALQMQTNIESGHLTLYVPPMTLQILIENAIKHNRASEKDPLVIEITSNNNQTLSVTNNINPKTTTYSTGTGLENIIKRYKFLSDKEVDIIHNEKQFIVTLPLLGNEK
ncbi:sensor histidine kinase [Natronoflexus pectinivorans]|uniref:Histidine kinase n=1 Tax=Natronoflexus pectinivorans TaxID=682526 RepID=A0A4R2GLF0_9BACT|nr:histidine kinase [Natronoflexus pectinivorans]TCO09805.1 histidine kinase [Natronoflexus pectinivorans]